MNAPSSNKASVQIDSGSVSFFCLLLVTVIFVLALIPVVNIIVGLVGSLVGLYFFAGIVLSILDYCKVLK